MSLEIIVAGGQSGADRAGLDVALMNNFPHGGWCPKGRKAEDGVIPPRYQLNETSSTGYRSRTEKNVRDSDGTLIITFAARLTGGSLLTQNLANKHGKPCLHVSRESTKEPASEIQHFIAAHGIRRLNVAGSRESKEPGLHDWAVGILNEALF